MKKYLFILIIVASLPIIAFSQQRPSFEVYGPTDNAYPTVQNVDVSSSYAGGSSWLSGGWSYRKEIIISKTNVSADLTNFPLYVKISNDSDMISALASGYDIRFTDSEGTNLLSYERESWSGGGGSAVTANFWVKVPLIRSSSDTVIYIYYGKLGATDGQNKTAVWDNYSMVYHLNEPTGTTGSGSVIDSTNNTSGTPSVGISFGQSGKAGTSVDFSTGTGINLGTRGSPLLTAETTISFWAYANNYSSPGRQNPLDQAYGGWGTMTIETSGVISWFFGSNGGNASPYSSHQSGSMMSNGSWIYVTAIRNPSGYTYKWYKNGLYLSGSTYSSSYPVISTRTFTLGDGYVYPFNGKMDEFRVAKAARSAEWVKFEYYNMSSANNELSWQSEESGGVEATATITANITDVSGVYSASTTIRDHDGVVMSNANLQSLGGDSWGTVVDVSSYPDGTYTVGFTVTDNLANSNPGGVYSNMGYFIKGQTFVCDPVDAGQFKNGARICVGISAGNSSQISSFTVTPSNTTPGELVTLTANLSGLSGETITFRDDTTALTLASVITNSSGIATFSYQPSFSGTHTLEAIYEGDSAKGYSPSIKTATLTLTGNCSSKNSANICIDTTVSDNANNFLSLTIDPPGDVSAGLHINVAAVLNNAGDGELITFRDDTTSLTIGSRPTVSNVAVIRYQPAFSGTHTLEAIYMGNVTKGLPPALKKVSLTVVGNCTLKNSANVCITTSTINPDTLNYFTISPASASAGFTVMLSAGSSLPAGETVNFRDDTLAFSLGTATTGATGTATFWYKPTFSGTHNIEAIYAGNMQTGLSPSMKAKTLTLTGNCVSKNSANVCIAPSTTNPATISSFTISPASTSAGFTVMLSANSSLPTGEIITFRDDTSTLTLGTATTGATGTATFWYKPAFSGTHNIEAIYAGDMSKALSPSMKAKTLTLTGNCKALNSANICITPSTTNPATLSSFNISPASTSAGFTIALRADSSLPAGETINFRDDTSASVLGTATTGATGTATFWYKPAFSGTHNIEAIYTGRGPTYSPSYKAKTLTLTGNCKAQNSASVCIGTSQATGVSSFIQNPSAGARNNYTGALGFQFTVSSNKTVTRLGRLYSAGNTQNHVIKIWDTTNTTTPVASETILAASASDGNGFKWVNITQITLLTTKTYRIAIDETSGGDIWKDLWASTGYIYPQINVSGSVYASSQGVYPSNFAASSSIYNTPAIWMNP